jgi:hypothetical protein
MKRLRSRANLNHPVVELISTAGRDAERYGQRCGCSRQTSAPDFVPYSMLFIRSRFDLMHQSLNFDDVYMCLEISDLLISRTVLELRYLGG